jgi:hypothetical protein
MSDFEDEFLEYSDYGDFVSEEEYGEENDSEEDSEEELEVEKLKSSLVKLNKHKPMENDFNTVWSLIVSCRDEMASSQDFNSASIILNAIQKLIDKEYTKPFYPTTLVIFLEYHS